MTDGIYHDNYCLLLLLLLGWLLQVNLIKPVLLSVHTYSTYICPSIHNVFIRF